MARIKERRLKGRFCAAPLKTRDRVKNPGCCGRLQSFPHPLLPPQLDTKEPRLFLQAAAAFFPLAIAIAPHEKTAAMPHEPVNANAPSAATGTDRDELFRRSGLREPLAFHIWHTRYRLARADGSSDELLPEDTHRRVVGALYEGDPRAGEFAPRVLAAMNAYRYIPGGRILAGAGAGRQVTLFNCFVGGQIEDSMTGIMQSLSESAMTLQQGGGIGNDFSTLRPKDALVARTDSGSSGPLSFMTMWDAMSATIESAGSRRGAMMATLADWHPDLPLFIAAKQKPAVLGMFNLSVLVSDAFMEAVRDGAMWELGFPAPHKSGRHAAILDEWPAHAPKDWPEYRGKGAKWYVYRRLPARELWNAILESTYRYAEPGVVYIDRVNLRSPLSYCEEIRCTNPCGEEPLPKYGSCNLGSLNASLFVKDPFADAAAFDEKAFAETVAFAVRTHDNVIDRSLYPLPRQREEALAKRRIGLGLTGVANALQKLRLRYGSSAAVKASEMIARTMRDAAYRASIELARERGPFPAFDRDRYLGTEWAKTLPQDIRQAVFEHGIRNGTLLDVAPTGTTSIAADNVSSGIEPTFAFSTIRNLTQSDGSRVPVRVTDAGLRDWALKHGEPECDENGAPKGLPPYMVAARDLAVEDHLAVMAAFQKYTDAAISKTINCPESMSFEEFKAVYDLAYKKGCKGCTTYRPDPLGFAVRGAILEAPGSREKKTAAEPSRPAALPLGANGKRPDILTGTTYKIKWRDGNIYVTINDALRDGRPHPYEMFVSTTAAVDRETCETTALLVTALLRQAADPTFIFEHLAQIQSADGGAWVAGRHLPSRAAAVAHILERHFAGLGLIDGKPAQNGDPAAFSKNASGAEYHAGETCPKCAAPALVRREGCNSCLQCGYSNCE